MKTKSRRAEPQPGTIKAGEFKARCLGIVDRVTVSGATVVITKRGNPVAQIAPFVRPSKPGIGFLRGILRSNGDIISPIDVEWDVLKP